MSRNRLLLSALVLAIAQIGFLSWIIVGRAAVLRDGREVTFLVKPIDPRDLLRGDFIRLDYDISRIPASIIENAPEGDFNTKDGAIYVRVAKGADTFWHPVSASLYEPSSKPLAPEEVELRGQIEGLMTVGPNSTVAAEYGLERFYLPEGTGMAIQNDMNVRPFAVKVAVADDGTPQIKAFLDGTTLLFEEPLY